MGVFVVSQEALTTGPDGHAPAAPTWKTLEATPETASALVPDSATVPLTTPATWFPTAIVAVGLCVSTTTVRPALLAVVVRSATWM